MVHTNFDTAVFKSAEPVRPTGAVILINEDNNLTPEIILKWMDKMSMKLYGEQYSFEFFSIPSEEEIEHYIENPEEYNRNFLAEVFLKEDRFLSYVGHGWSRLTRENFTTLVSGIFNFPLYTAKQLIKVMKGEYPTELYFDEEGEGIKIIFEKDDYLQIMDDYPPVNRNLIYEIPHRNIVKKFLADMKKDYYHYINDNYFSEYSYSGEKGGFQKEFSALLNELQRLYEEYNINNPSDEEDD